MPTIGVQYTPSTPTLRVPSIDDLRRSGIAYVRVQWVDLINNIRYRVLPINYFAKLLQSDRPAVSLTKATLGLIFLSMADGFGPTGEYSYIIDLLSLRICMYAPRHASVMGWFQEKYPTPLPNPSFDVDICPRALLKRVLDNAKRVSSVEFLVGFETEFVLLKAGAVPQPQAVNNHGWSNSPALLTGSAETVALEEMADALVVSGIELQMYHSEGAPGQFEIVTGPLPPLQAADSLIHTRETIYNIANKHGLKATLAPRVFGDTTGSATHAHISVHSTSPLQNERSSSHPDLTQVESSFLAGLLARLPSLCLLTLPLYASYDRMQDGIWSGGTYVCWGIEHRETPIRLCNAKSPSSRNFEYKIMDGTSNPYLALAGILGAGWAGGVKVKKELLHDGLVGKLSAAELNESDRTSLGITKRLPLNLKEARQAFGEDPLLKEVLGEGFVEAFLSVNHTLDYRMNVSSADEAFNLLIDMY